MNSHPFWQEPLDPEPAVIHERAHIARRDGRLPRMNAMYERIEDKEHCLAANWCRDGVTFATGHDSLGDLLAEAPEGAALLHAIEFVDATRFRDVTADVQDRLDDERERCEADADSWAAHERGTRRMRVA